MEFLLNIPFTPKDKSNMNALLMARNDGEHYGKLFMYSFPKDKLVQGPQMVESRIDQDTVISQQLTFWDQKGSAVLRGNLMTIPIKNSLLYVEPIYLRSSGERSLPEMKRAIVSYNGGDPRQSAGTDLRHGGAGGGTDGSRARDGPFRR